MKILNITNEQLSAFVDGELEDDLSSTVSAMIKEDPELMARVEKLQITDGIISRTYSAIDEKPMPQGVLDLLEADEEKNKLSTFFNKFGEFFTGKQTLSLAFSMAAITIISIPVVTTILSTSQHSTLVLSGTIDKSSMIYDVLEMSPSTTLTALGDNNKLTITPIYTFKTTTGNYCREFVQQLRDQQARAIACRNNNNWEIQVAGLEIVSANDGGEYSTASMADSVKFDLFIEKNIANEPFDSNEEQIIIEKRWQ